MEVLGDSTDKLRMHIHYLDSEKKEQSDGHTNLAPDLSQDWHVYALLWQQDKLVWYLDGDEQWRFEEALHIPAEKLYFLANLAVGGQWPGAPDANTAFPSDFLIDYVAIWQAPR